MYRIINVIIILCIIFVLGCAYYNTFFNAKEYYKTGEKKQKNSISDNVPSDVKTSYNNAIKKCWKLIDTYGDSSEYADDALLLIGKSHYNIQEYELSEKVLNQFLLKYLNSELIPDAKLWLAKNYIELEKDDEALDLLDNIFDNKVSNEVAAKAFFILGNLYFKNEDYENAIDNFQKCVEITDDDEIKGEAEYKSGESFFILEEYENAIYHFQKIQNLDVPVIKEYEALMQKINALSKLERYEEADQILRLMLSNQRFIDQFSLIETKLANISEIQGDIEYAMELYYDILNKYPKKEGAALSAFYLGQLYEFEYGDFDSAKTYYDRVNQEYNRSEAKEDATSRANLLKEYLIYRMFNLMTDCLMTDSWKQNLMLPVNFRIPLFRLASKTPPKRGTAMAMTAPMMAMTTMISRRVKAPRPFRGPGRTKRTVLVAGSMGDNPVNRGCRRRSAASGRVHWTRW